MAEASVGIVAYRRPAAVADALGRLAHPDLDVVVVNVGRDPEVAAAVRNCGASARLVEIDNRGYAAAVNAVATHASADVVVFANDDARIDAEGVLRLARVVTAREADVAVPQVVDRHRRLERTIAAVPSPGALAREWLLLPDRPIARVARRLRVEKWRAPRQPERIEAASAVVVAVRRSLLLEEPMPEAYFLYWEESEWFWRLRQRGAVVQYRPDVTCEHDGGRDDVRAEKSRLLARNAVRCVRRTQGRRAAAAAFAVVLAWNARLVVGDGVRWLGANDTSHRDRLRARWAGFCAALSSWAELR